MYTKRIQALKSIALIYVVILHLALVAMLLTCDGMRRNLGLSQEAELSDYYWQMVSFQHRVAGNLPASSVIFVGDSLTQGLCTSCIRADSVNFGIGGDTTRGVIARLPEYKALAQAKALVLTIGLNDVLRGRDSGEVLENYGEIIRLIPPSTKLIMSAVLPIDPAPTNRSPELTVIIDRLNDLSGQLCEHAPSCVHLKTPLALVNKDGTLVSKYHLGDGIHLNAAGYEIWIDHLRSQIDLLLKEE